MNSEEIIRVVRELNEGIDYEIEDVSQVFHFEARTDGFSTAVDWMGINLWSTEDDCRDYCEEKDEYEPLSAYLKRERDKMLDNAIRHKTARAEQGESTGSASANTPNMQLAEPVVE